MLSLFGHSARRTVRCLHCASPFVVPSSASTLTCPICYERVRVDDVVITGRENHHKIETCGVVVVRKFAHVHADVLSSGTGILVEGEVQARVARTPSLVLGPAAVWTGDVEAQSLSIDPTSTIKGGKFQIKSKPKGKPKPSAKVN